MPEKKSGTPASGRKAVELDLSDPVLYWDGVEWLRSNVVLKPSGNLGVIELDIRLPLEQRATLFANTKDLYILGFQGADRVYLLDDPLSPQFEKLLKQHLGVDSQTRILKGLSSQHGEYGLGTFQKQGEWNKGRKFHKSDVKFVNQLAKYSLGVNYEALRTPLSLLVCIIAESARFPMLQMAFTNMFEYGHEVIASDAIRSYADARFLIRVSLIAFSLDPRRQAVERLRKRAAELDSILEVLDLPESTPNRQTQLQQALDGRLSSHSSKQEHATEELRRVAKDLKVNDIARALEMPQAEVITQLVTTCKNDSAVFAAKEGIAVPAIGIAP